MKTLAGWISTGVSGSVVGLAGAGKSNFLGFLCHRPEAVRAYLPSAAGPVALVLVDLNNLTANNLATFYRLVLRAFFETRHRFEQALQKKITHLYQDNRTERDPFLPYSALRELILSFQAERVRVVLVLDHFDNFCRGAPPQTLETLRGLRDGVKDTLSYVVGLRQEVAYLPDPASLGELTELLDNQVCWVGPMVEADARQLIAQEIQAGNPPDEAGVARLLALTGGHPALLKAACRWWLARPGEPPAGWAEPLLADRRIRYRLDEIWADLTPEEHLTLAEVQRLQAQAAGQAAPKAGGRGQTRRQQRVLDRAFAGLERQHGQTLKRLAIKGLCRQQGTAWCIFSELLAAYVAEAEGRGSGAIWLEEGTEELYQGQTLLVGLTPLERSVLRFLLAHPRQRHTKTDLIASTWPDELRRQGVTDDSLYQVIMELRKKIEPNPARPRYLLTWRGRPEGGYQFFPEGRSE